MTNELAGTITHPSTLLRVTFTRSPRLRLCEENPQTVYSRWADKLRDLWTPCHRCLRSLDCSCCCEAGCCFPDYQSRSGRSALPTLRLVARFGLSSCFSFSLFRIHCFAVHGLELDRPVGKPGGLAFSRVW